MKECLHDLHKTIYMAEEGTQRKSLPMVTLSLQLTNLQISFLLLQYQTYLNFFYKKSDCHIIDL